MSDAEYCDGNAAAGALSRVFAVDMTAAILTCSNCSHEGPIGELHLYGRAPGQVLRCSRCEAVNLRIVEYADQIVLHFDGSVRLTVRD